ncbi:MAG TPA: hypothetical protein VF618_16620 [Thermoanaerobaculia bacterium]
MKRKVLPLVLLFVLGACATTAPSSAPTSLAEPADIEALGDPLADPTIAAEVEETAGRGRRIGTAIGVIAAVLSVASDDDSVDNAIDGVFVAREAGEAIGAMLGATRGAKRSIDTEMAELQALSGVEVVRPDLFSIDVTIIDAAQIPVVAEIVARYPSRVRIEGDGDLPFDTRDALIEAGVPPAQLDARRTDDGCGVRLHVHLGT